MKKEVCERAYRYYNERDVRDYFSIYLQDDGSYLVVINGFTEIHFESLYDISMFAEALYQEVNSLNQ